MSHPKDSDIMEFINITGLSDIDEAIRFIQATGSVEEAVTLYFATHNGSSPSKDNENRHIGPTMLDEVIDSKYTEDEKKFYKAFQKKRLSWGRYWCALLMSRFSQNAFHAAA